MRVQVPPPAPSKWAPSKWEPSKWEPHTSCDLFDLALIRFAHAAMARRILLLPHAGKAGSGSPRARWCVSVEAHHYIACRRWWLCSRTRHLRRLYLAATHFARAAQAGFTYLILARNFLVFSDLGFLPKICAGGPISSITPS